MADFQDFQPCVYYEMEDAILWPLVDRNFDYRPYDVNTTAGLLPPNESNLAWENAATSSSYSSTISQPICNTEQMERPNHSFIGSEGQDVTSCLNFGLHSQTPQWHVQEQDLAWQSLDHCCNNDAYLHAQDGALSNTPLFSRQSMVSTQQNPIPQTHNPNPIAQTPMTVPLPDVFASTRAPYQDPPTASTPSTPVESHPQRKSKRCSDDLYTPRWVRHAGTSREGWCGWCASWFTLRDSAYWYHMHYSHGVSQANSGKRLPGPAGFRAFGVVQPVEWEVKCGKCARWMPLPPGDKWNTAYFRHTYKCYFKTISSAKGDRSGPSSPGKTAASPPRRPRRLDML